MASSVNKVTLIGNLGRDPEVRQLNSGEPVVSLRVATSETWKDKDSGERKEKTEWHSVVIYNENLARIAEQYLRKGSKVYVEGQLQTRKWIDQSGVEKYTTEIVLQRYRGELAILEGRGDGRGDSGEAPSGESDAKELPARTAGERRTAPAPARRPARKLELTDDIPF